MQARRLVSCVARQSQVRCGPESTITCFEIARVRHPLRRRRCCLTRTRRSSTSHGHVVVGCGRQSRGVVACVACPSCGVSTGSGTCDLCACDVIRECAAEARVPQPLRRRRWCLVRPHRPSKRFDGQIVVGSGSRSHGVACTACPIGGVSTSSSAFAFCGRPSRPRARPRSNRSLTGRWCV